jgi:protein-disulfide isomerase
MSPQSHPVSLAVPPEPTDHLLGSEHARVTLVEYGDFECPSCKVAVTTPTLLLERFPNKIRFIFRHFPVQEAHPHAQMAAEVSEAAAAQGKFWRMHDVLFQNQAHLKDKDLYHYAVGLGLDMARYTAEMDDRIYLQKVREHVEGARRSHIRATPTFFLDGVVQDISFGMKALHDAVASAVARGN